VLVVEVADSSLHFDRRDKGSLYARGGVQDYWIVNLVDRVLEVYRDPGPDALAPFGWHYRSVEGLAPPGTVTLHGLPAVRVAVAHLLP
jgi:Uma2 family endonuclease